MELDLANGLNSGKLVVNLDEVFVQTRLFLVGNFRDLKCLMVDFIGQQDLLFGLSRIYLTLGVLRSRLGKHKICLLLELLELT